LSDSVSGAAFEAGTTSVQIAGRYGSLMAETRKVKKGGYIRMVASLAGDDFAWSPGQVLRVGPDIEERMAEALVSAPADDPRALVIGADEAKRLLAAETPPEQVAPANEIPPPPRKANNQEGNR
jgi:hypothetical protein